MRYVPPAYPIANISIANTHFDLVDRVQILIDLVNSRHIFLLDDISPQFNGAQTVFQMTAEGGHTVYATTAQNVIIDINGTRQEPRIAYNVYKNEITFTSPPLAGSSFHGIVMDVWAGTFSGAGPSDTAYARSAGSSQNANNADFLDGLHASQLNVNSATYVTGTVLNANNADFLDGMHANQLTVGFANDANYLNGQAPAYYLNANNFTGTLPVSVLTGNYTNAAVNNSAYAYGKNENQLNVNSALTANTANAANTAESANTANLAAYATTLLGSINSAAFLAGNVITTNTSALAVGVAGIYANSSLGSNGQVLTSNGTSLYWATASAANGNATFLTGNAVTTNSSALILGTGATLYANGGKGTNGQILYSNGSADYWGDAPAGLGSHNFLSATHSDTNAAAVVRGDLITGQGASPLWTRLAIGGAGQALTSNGSEPVWSASVNNATYAYGKTEGNLNVNSALNANNSGYLNGHAEAALAVNTALTANNATYAFGKSEGSLNVNSALASNTANSALSANNASYLNGHTEAQLNANSALSANNSGYLNGHTEAQLSVNSALSANNSGYLSGHTEAQLNVNNATTSGTANNATYAYGKGEGNLNVNSALTANNSGYLNGHTEAQLSVNNALGANNASYLNTHTETQLNVNSALGANNATYAFGKTEGNLNVNNALTANDSSYLGGNNPQFYANSSNANTGTLPDARLSANVVRYATAQTQNYVLAAPAGANGNITFRALTSNDVTNLDERVSDMNIYGFAVEGDSECAITFDANTYTLTLANTTAAGWDFFVEGIEYHAVGTRTVTLPGSPPAPNTYYIYIDGTTGANANLVANATPWTLSDYDAKVPVAAILWNNSNTPKYFFGDDRHTASISRPLHRYLHNTRGTQYVSGGELSGQTFNSSVNTALTFSVANTVIMDETVTHLILGVADGDGNTNNYTILYHSNSTFYTWAPSPVPFPFVANGAYTNPQGRIQWDNGSGLTEGVSTQWYTSYIAVMSLDEGPGGNTGVIILPGRGDYNNQALAEAENPANFDFTGLGIAEMVILWRCTWQCNNTYATKGRVRLQNFVRVHVTVSTSTSGTTVTDHNLLTGLQGGTTGEFFHITSAQWANGDLTANQANNASYLNTHTEAQLNVNGAITANHANTANSSTYPAGLVAVFGDLIIGNATPAWAKLPAGANGYVLTVNANSIGWASPEAGADTHNLLQSNVHLDTSNGTVTRGDVITAQGASPKWNRLPIGANTYVLTSNGTEAVWSAPSTNGTSLNANNADYLNGHTEAQLNVNSAMTANNATYAFGKTEVSLNVNSALTANQANNADLLDGNHAANLNVNSALSSNNAGYLSGHTEGQLNVNSAIGANNSAYLNGHTEAQLNVNSAVSSNTTNSALFANNSTYAYGKTEGNLNVNAATRLSALADVNMVYAGPVPTGGLSGTTDFSVLGNQDPYVTSDYTCPAGGSPFTWDKGTIASGAWYDSYNRLGALITANTVSANQFAEVTLKNNATQHPNSGPGVHLSDNGSGGITGYMMRLIWGGGSNYTQMRLGVVSGTSATDLANYNVTVGAGSKIKLRIAGTTLTVSVDDVDLGNTVVDGNYTTGKPGLVSISSYSGSAYYSKLTWGEGAGAATSGLPTFRALELSDLPAGITANDTTHIQTFAVSANTPANAQVLTFDTTANTWYPMAPAGGTVYAENLQGTMINTGVTNSSLHTLGTLVALQVNTMLFVNSTNVGIGTTPNGAFEILAESIIIGIEGRNDTFHSNTSMATFLKGHGRGIGFQPKASYNTHVYFSNTGVVLVGNAGFQLLHDETAEGSLANGMVYTSLTYSDYGGTANNTLNLRGRAVSANTPVDAQVLTWNAAANTWLAATNPAGSGTNLLMKKLDDFDTSFNGSQTAFTLMVSSTEVTPVSNQNVLIYLNGILQEPGAAYSVTGNTIVFSTAPDSNSECFGIFVQQETGVTAYGKAENQLNVNSAIFASTATYLGNTGAAQLNVNSAVFANSFGGTVWTIPTQPTTVLYKSANDSALPFDTPTAILFDSEYGDVGNGHSLTANTDKVFISTNGWYHVCATVHLFEPDNLTNFRRIEFQKTGNSYFAMQDSYCQLTNSSYYLTTSQLMYMFSGEWVRVVAHVYGGSSSSCFVRGGGTSDTMFEVTLLH